MSVVNALNAIDARPVYSFQIQNDSIFQTCTFRGGFDPGMIYSIVGYEFHYASPITEEHLKQLQKLQSLEYLRVGGNPHISDKSVESIAKLKDLRILDIKGTAITEDGYLELKKRLPQARIRWSRTSVSPAKESRTQTVLSGDKLGLLSEQSLVFFSCPH